MWGNKGSRWNSGTPQPTWWSYRALGFWKEKVTTATELCLWRGLGVSRGSCKFCRGNVEDWRALWEMAGGTMGGPEALQKSRKHCRGQGGTVRGWKTLWRLRVLREPGGTVRGWQALWGLRSLEGAWRSPRKAVGFAGAMWKTRGHFGRRQVAL